jgi:hypothetical protein
MAERAVKGPAYKGPHALFKMEDLHRWGEEAAPITALSDNRESLLQHRHLLVKQLPPLPPKETWPAGACCYCHTFQPMQSKEYCESQICQRLGVVDTSINENLQQLRGVLAQYGYLGGIDAALIKFYADRMGQRGKPVLSIPTWCYAPCGLHMYMAVTRSLFWLTYGKLERSPSLPLLLQKMRRMNLQFLSIFLRKVLFLFLIALPTLSLSWL